MNDEGEQRVVDSVWRTLRMSLGLVPLVAGLDKFTNLLADWREYLAPAFARIIPLAPDHFMRVVGIVEVVAGFGLLFTPWTKTFAYVVAGWLTCIAVNLAAAGYFDIAVRDLVMAMAAVSLARLTDVAHVAATAPASLRPASTTT